MSQQINLYEVRLRPRHELATARNLAVATVVALALVAGASGWMRAEAARKSEAAASARKQVEDEQARLIELTKQLKERQVSQALVADIEAAKAMLAVRQEVVDVLDSGSLGNTEGFSGYMTGFARRTANDLWLTGFRILQGGAEIEIRGRMLNAAGLPAYVQQLNAEAVFRGRRFASLEMKAVEPALPKDEASKTAEVAEATPRLPAYVEFALRSEAVAAASEATAGKGAR